MDLVGIAAIGLYLASGVALFVGRNWIKAELERGVQFRFDTQIEKLRAELHKSEETFRSDLRLKESELSALRDGVLSGRAQRQATLDKRKLEAVERTWVVVGNIGRHKMVSGFLSVLKLEVVAKEAAQSPKMQEAFRILAPQEVPDGADPAYSVHSERPFLSPLAWAFYAAYQAVIFHAVFYAKVMALGIPDPGTLLKEDYVQNLLKSALPHYSDYIDQFGVSGFHNLLEELESRLLVELQRMLEGEETDTQNLQQAANILEQVKKVNESTEQRSAELAPSNPSTR
jgi:hypothetical protein